MLTVFNRQGSLQEKRETHGGATYAAKAASRAQDLGRVVAILQKGQRRRRDEDLEQQKRRRRDHHRSFQGQGRTKHCSTRQAAPNDGQSVARAKNLSPELRPNSTALQRKSVGNATDRQLTSSMTHICIHVHVNVQ